MNLDRLTVFDYETSGSLPEYALQSWRIPQGKAWATSLCWLTREGGVTHHGGGILDTVDQPQISERSRALAATMLQEAIDHDRILGGWNLAFDISILLAYDLEHLVSKCRFVDGMLLWRHAFLEPEYDINRDKKRSYGLKAFVAEHFPDLAGYADEVDFHDASVEERTKLHRYNQRDCLATYAGIKLLWARLTHEQQRAALIEAQCLPLVAGANFRGLPIDPLATRELQASLHDTANRCLTELAPFGVTEKVVRSPLQLAGLLFDQWGLPVLKENVGKKTKKVSRATDKEVLHELAFKDPRARTLHQYREALGNRVKFADNILESTAYNEDGRVHPQGIIFGTYSSRLTYASKQGKNKDARPVGFAIHQEKGRAEGRFYRRAIVAPEGYDLVEFDAAGQEFRWMAILSEDEAMLQLCLPGEDAHSFMGAQISAQDYRGLVDKVKLHDHNAESIRKLGKLANLSLQYRTSARKLRVKARVDYDIPMEMPQAYTIHSTYQRAYQGVPAYWDRQIRKTKKLGYVETLAGRRVEVKGNWAGPDGWSMESTSLNYPIQGTGGEQKYLALAVLKPYLTEIGAHFAWDLHDGIFIFVPKTKTAQAMPKIKQMLDHLPYKRAWGFDPPIPLPWDARIGGSWGDLQDWKE